MKLMVLGAAAGGGFPQWNSNAPACQRARSGDPAAAPRTQAGLAVSLTGERWYLLNASPDLRAQIAATPALHPAEGLRSSPIKGVVLTGGDVDVITAFSSDGRIAQYGLTLLSDPKGALPPYDAVLLVGPAHAHDAALLAALRPLVGAIDLATMQKANLMVDRDQDKQTVAQTARWLDRRLTPRH